MNDGAARTAMESPQGNGSALSREFQNLIADIGDLVRVGTSITNEDFTRLKQKITDRVGAARESLEHGGQAAAAKARKAATATDEYVQQEPWKSVGAGAAIGFLLGFMVARR
jgi:ElaB/YqjD/DUF883 family membrane-anchored ribosome-binding protein